MFRYLNLEDFNLKGKTVGVRVDFNSPLFDGKVQSNERIESHIETLKDLQKMGAKIVLLAHQGRPGKDDFISLKQHSELLGGKLNGVKFVDEVFSEKVCKEIDGLREGEILLVENLRFIEDEMDSSKKENRVKKLIGKFDFYVMDAFSVAHRSQASVLGNDSVPMLAGRVMEKELKGLNKITDVSGRPFIYLFGGAKPDDLVELMNDGLEKGKVDFVLASGVLGEIILMIQGYEIGKKKQFMEEKGYLKVYDRVKEIYDKHKDKILTPLDVALYDGKKRFEISLGEFEKNRELLNKYMIQDIGKKTVSYYKDYIESAGSVYFKGPMGNFEEKSFAYGTRETLRALERGKGFRYLGGGHSLTAVEMFSSKDKFDYVSLAGGALVHFLKGDELPGVKVLERSFWKFEKEFDDFLVIGSNVLDHRVKADVEFEKVHLGDKVRVPENFEVSLGGGGTNAAVALRRLGGSVSYAGKLSEESVDFVEKELGKEKVNLVKKNVSKRPAAKSFVVDFPEDRIIFSYRGQDPYLKVGDIDEEKLNARNVYFSGLTGESFRTLLALAPKLKGKGAKICFNPSMYEIESERVINLVKQVDVLVLNFEEAKELCGKENLEETAKSLSEKVGEIVVITDGAHGAYAHDGSQLYFRRSERVKVVDSTGAGDAFASTFFYFYINGFGVEKALDLSVKNSAEVVASKGTKAGLKYYEDLLNKNN